MNACLNVQMCSLSQDLYKKDGVIIFSNKITSIAVVSSGIEVNNGCSTIDKFRENQNALVFGRVCPPWYNNF